MLVLTILVPVYNEEKTIGAVLDKIANVRLVGDIAKEIIVINDASTDHTDSIVREYMSLRPDMNILYYPLEVNQGKGFAIRTGIEAANGTYIIIQDADLEYDPEEYNLLVKPLLKNVADVVFGSRFMGGGPHRILFFWHSIGNKFLTFFSNVFSDLNLTDMETGYKCFKSTVIKQLYLKENRFGFEPEITSKVARVPGIRIYEVGISYFGRTYLEGKKIHWRDGVRALYAIVKYGLFDRRFLKSANQETAEARAIVKNQKSLTP